MGDTLYVKMLSKLVEYCKYSNLDGASLESSLVTSGISSLSSLGLLLLIALGLISLAPYLKEVQHGCPVKDVISLSVISSSLTAQNEDALA